MKNHINVHPGELLREEFLVPAGSAPGGVDARTARKFITADAVALAKAAEVERADLQAERFEMRPRYPDGKKPRPLLRVAGP